MSNNEPLVSVLIPAYNHEKYVQETIQTIINQTYQNIELIVIDDGSKDLTWQKIQELRSKCEERFIKVHFETKENEGICVTLNRLLTLAKGDYIYMIASDDLAKPGAIEIELKFLETHKDYALCVGDNEIIDCESKKAYWDKNRNLVYDEKKAVYKTFADFLQKLHKFKFISKEFGTYNRLSVDNHVPNGFLLRKTIYDKVGQYTSNAPVEDWWLMMQISKYAKMKYIDKILFSYRWHGANTITNTDKMIVLAQKTRSFEEKVLNELDISDCLPEIAHYKKYGQKYKQFGIPKIFQIEKYKKNQNKYIRMLIFGTEAFYIKRK